MNFRIASSLLLATAVTFSMATAMSTKSKAYRIFPLYPRPKTWKVATTKSRGGKSSSSASEKSINAAKSTSKAAKSKVVKSKCIEQSVSMSLSPNAIDVVGRFLGTHTTLSLSLMTQANSKATKSTKCLATMTQTVSPSTYFPSYSPTLAPTTRPTTRRPTQRMICQSGAFVDALGRDCFWYEAGNVEQGCESLREDVTGVDLTNSDGKTPWDECCYCGGGTMVVPEPTITRNLRVLTDPDDLGQQKMEVVSLSADREGKPRDTRIFCISARDFVDPLGRDCFFYVPENIDQGCESLHVQANEFPWTNGQGLTPWSECCWCGGGTIGYEPSVLLMP